MVNNYLIIFFVCGSIYEYVDYIYMCGLVLCTEIRIDLFDLEEKQGRGLNCTVLKINDFFNIVTLCPRFFFAKP